jgi:hypothetical protein
LNANADMTHGSESARTGSPAVQREASGDIGVSTISRGYEAGSALVTRSENGIWTVTMRALGTVRLAAILLFILAAGVGSCVCVLDH